MKNKPVIGIDIGGTKIAGAIVTFNDERYTLENLTIVPTPAASGPDAVLQAAIQVGLNLKKAASHDVAAVGIGTAGQVHVTQGYITHAVDTLPGWGGTLVLDAMTEALKLPGVIDNDVNAMALGESQFGAGRDFQDMLFVTVGTGIGGALVLNGQLWHGVHWSAGELGHIPVDWQSERPCLCGGKGHLESYAAGPALVQQYKNRVGVDSDIDLKMIAQRAQAGESSAQEVIAEGAHILGLALGGLLNVFDPAALIIGGGVVGMGSLWWHPFEAALRLNPMPCPQQVVLRPATAGPHATLIGAAWMASQNM